MCSGSFFLATLDIKRDDFYLFLLTLLFPLHAPDPDTKQIQIYSFTQQMLLKHVSYAKHCASSRGTILIE